MNSRQAIVPPPINLADVRAKLNAARGQQYWRSLEEIAQTNEFQQMLHREFPAGAAEWWDGVSRRNFLKMAAATMALAGLNACTKQPVREIFPYVKQPEELVLGEPLYYASSMLLGGFATGILAKSREGHPIKVDGNPEHPSSLGGSSIWVQSSILDLYDPDRSQTVTHDGEISTWAVFLSDLNLMVQEEAAAQGAGLRFLTETITSPTLANELDQLLKKFPRARWYQFDPVLRDNVREGARLAFGEFVEAHYQFDKAAVIVALDADFLYTHPQRLTYARQFIEGRRLSSGKREMSRFYAAESTPSITGAMADHRIAVEDSGIAELARAIAQELGHPVRPSPTQLTPARHGWVKFVANDLREHRGAGIVIAGEWQPPMVHALAHQLNQVLGNAGHTVFYSQSAEARPAKQLTELQQLTTEITSGDVQTLFILGLNPVYAAPADLGFGELLKKVKRSIHLGMTLDETAALCSWHIPQNHFLESWGDARAFDGTVSLIQPLIAPLYDGKTAAELLGAMLQQQPIRTDYELLVEFWRQQRLWPDFEKGWRSALHQGFIAGTNNPPKEVQLKPSAAEVESNNQRVPLPQTPNIAVKWEKPTELQAPFGAVPRREVRIEGLEVTFRPDPNLWDGSFANNGWLQECPRPLTKLTWDNAVLMSPALAERAGLTTNDVVEVQVEGRKVRGPVWVMPGQAENTVTLHLGYGRSRIGRVGQGVGFNAYALRTTRAPWSASGATLVSTGQRHLLVATQTHHQLHSPERQVYRAGTLNELRSDPLLIKKTVSIPTNEQTLFNTDEFKYEGYKWGMSIDLTTCIGCNACVVACEVENNIPVVGKEQVYKNREMLWLRVDTYYRGNLENPQFHHAPVPCMHCEHAPCELVCPVEAAVHDSEGLNVQVYNRCVGTRFCSNNCPYKVRRFNFLHYSDYQTPNFRPMYNPEVTVRWRGVMEKCTYCIQRIAAARINAEKENRRIRDGEVQTACQQACPTQAIVFGDLNSPGAKVAKLKAQPLDYPMLGELNVRPRTTYLAKITNPAPNLEPKRGAEPGEVL